MSAYKRRGACPSLAQPMQTGDGLLVRLAPAAGGFSPMQLEKLAEAAASFGNGLLEVTQRGNLQIRGLSAQTVSQLEARVAELKIVIRTGLPVATGPLSGLCADEISDPRTLAAQISRNAAQLGLLPRLGPKVSITVDGGGALHLREIIADIKLEAIAPERWLIAIGGNEASARVLGIGDCDTAAGTAIAILCHLAELGPEARARDLDDAACSSLGLSLAPARATPRRERICPIGMFRLANGAFAHGFGLAFGQVAGSGLQALAQACANAHEIRLAPGGGLLVLGLPESEAEDLIERAGYLGFVTAKNDPRLLIVTCAGAPSCGSASLNTKALAEEAARLQDVFDGSFRLHLSGCAKRCAQPRGPNISLTGGEAGCAISAENSPLSAQLHAFLTERGRAHHIPSSRKTA